MSEYYDGNSPDVYYVTHAQYVCVGSKSNYVEAYATDADWVAVFGGAGNDTIICGVSRHLDIDAGGGNDLISLADMNWATVNGGGGNDTVDFSRNLEGVSADLTGGPTYKIGDPYVWSILKNVENLTGSGGSDRLTGSRAANLLSGDAGNDSLYGGGGNDTLKGGDGDDVIFQSALLGSSRIDGGAGNDRFVQVHHNGIDSFDGGSGFDTADYSGLNSADVSISADLAAGTIARQHTITLQQYGQNINYVQSDIDTIRNIDAVIGTDNNDFLNGVFVTAGPVALYGRGGNDLLCGSVGDDTLNGGAGNDFVVAGAGDDRIEQDSWSGNDTISGGVGMNMVDYSGLAAVAGVESHIVVNLGIDRIEKFQNGVATGTDLVADDVEQVIGTAFNDVLYGDANANHLVGGAGNDTFVGAVGNDLLEGGSGNDFLVGGAGDDIINGGTGNDVIRLDGGGNDTFIFDSHFGQDSITRVNPADANGQDVVQFNGINAADILFQRQGDDLRITVAASTDTLTLLNWYAHPGAGSDSPSFDVDQFQAGEIVLSADTVEQMVTIVGAAPVSMAELSAPVR